MLQYNPFDPFGLSLWWRAYSQWLYGTLLPSERANREFIRHPSDIPIDFQIEEGQIAQFQTKDVSVGGLCFAADHQVPCGKKIHIHIPVSEEFDNRFIDAGFDGDGVVAWCRRQGDHYEVGVRFEDASTQFGLRMVEQVCHIEHYRSDVLQIEGRALSREEAAREWVERFAHQFPV